MRKYLLDIVPSNSEPHSEELRVEEVAKGNQLFWVNHAFDISSNLSAAHRKPGSLST